MPRPKRAKTLDEYPSVLLIDEICEILRLSRSAVYQLRRRGVIQAIPNLGRVVRVWKTALPMEMVPPQLRQSEVTNENRETPRSEQTTQALLKDIRTLLDDVKCLES